MTIFGDPLWSEIISIMNILLGLTLSLFSFKMFKLDHSNIRWLFLILSLLGMYWFGLYLFVLLTKSGTYDAVKFGQIFVRPFFSINLAVMASIAIYTVRSHRP